MLKSWRKYPGYEKCAGDALKILTALVNNQNSGDFFKESDEYHLPQQKKQKTQGQGILL